MLRLVAATNSGNEGMDSGAHGERVHSCRIDERAESWRQLCMTGMRFCRRSPRGFAIRQLRIRRMNERQLDCRSSSHLSLLHAMRERVTTRSQASAELSLVHARAGRARPACRPRPRAPRPDPGRWPLTSSTLLFSSAGATPPDERAQSLVAPATAARATPRIAPATSATLRKKRPDAPAIGPPGLSGPYRVPDGQGHGEAHSPALPDLVPHGRAAPGDRAGDPPRRRGLQRDERGRVRAALLRRPLRAGLAGHRADRRAAGRRRRRAGELLAAPGELPPARRSPSPTPSWPGCRPRCRCSTASSPTPSRCAWRCSRSRGDARTR